MTFRQTFYVVKLIQTSCFQNLKIFRVSNILWSAKMIVDRTNGTGIDFLFKKHKKTHCPRVTQCFFRSLDTKRKSHSLVVDHIIAMEKNVYKWVTWPVTMEKSFPLNHFSMIDRSLDLSIMEKWFWGKRFSIVNRSCELLLWRNAFWESFFSIVDARKTTGFEFFKFWSISNSYY